MSSGWDILQAVAATAELIKLAQETVKFLIRVTRAQREAVQLLENTKNLAGLVENVDKVLKHRSESRGSYVLSSPEQSIVEQLEGSIDRCAACLNGIRESFEPLANKGRLFARAKFVIDKNQIAKRESEVLNQISLLSSMLSLLSFLEHSEHEAAERQHRLRQDQYQQRMETRVALLLQHVALMYQRTESYATAGTYDRPASHGSSETETVMPRPLRSIENNQAPTLQDILGRPSRPSDSEGHLQVFQFPSHQAPHEDETEMAISDELSDRALSYTSSIEEVYSDSDLTSSIDIKQFADDTTLITAVEENEVNLVRDLVCGEDARANVTVRDEHGWTLLHHAVFRHHEEIVEILLDQDACKTREYLNAKNNVGETALIVAARAKSKKAGLRNIERLLAQSECQINATDGLNGRTGFTALYYAVHDGDPTFDTRKKTVRLLAKNGADVQAVHDQIPSQVRNYSFLTPYITNSTTSKGGRRRASEATRDSRNSRLSDLLSRRNSETPTELTPSTTGLRRLSWFSRRTDSTGGPSG